VIAGPALKTPPRLSGCAIADPGSQDPTVQGMRAFFDALAAEPDVRATTIQTVGQKGYDGFALVLVGG
jgi:hypothetical protein